MTSKVKDFAFENLDVDVIFEIVSNILIPWVDNSALLGRLHQNTIFDKKQQVAYDFFR